MKEVVSDIWAFRKTHWICITTNAGWKVNGDNVMGAGLAKQASSRFPMLARRYGAFCRMNPGAAKLYPYKSYENWLIMYPTKALNPDVPHLSWRSKSSIELIEKCAVELVEFAKTSERPIAVPALGCRNGGLNVHDVLDVLYKYLHGDQFTFVHEPPF